MRLRDVKWNARTHLASATWLAPYSNFAGEQHNAFAHAIDVKQIQCGLRVSELAAVNRGAVMPGRHAEFKIKRLNRQAAVANTWIDLERWNRCGGPVDLGFLKGNSSKAFNG